MYAGPSAAASARSRELPRSIGGRMRNALGSMPCAASLSDDGSAVDAPARYGAQNRPPVTSTIFDVVGLESFVNLPDPPHDRRIERARLRTQRHDAKRYCRNYWRDKPLHAAS
jgi:hypothetical protein